MSKATWLVRSCRRSPTPIRVAFTADGALATVGAGGLQLWDLSREEELVHVPDVSGHVAVSRDGRHLAMTHKDFGIVLRSLQAPLLG